MSTRCVACRKPAKRGQLFCPDCLKKRAPASARKQERRRRGQLLERILSLPHLSVSARRSLATTEDTWNDTRREIQNNPRAKALFMEAAVSLGIDLLIADMDASTARLIFREMANIGKRSGRYKTAVFDVQRRLLALSSSLLGALVVVLALLSFVLLLID